MRANRLTLLPVTSTHWRRENQHPVEVTFYSGSCGTWSATRDPLAHAGYLSKPN